MGTSEVFTTVKITVVIL